MMKGYVFNVKSEQGGIYCCSFRHLRYLPTNGQQTVLGPTAGVTARTAATVSTGEETATARTGTVG